MSATSEAARSKARAKIERLTRSDPHERVDASNYAPDGAMDAGLQTGPRPISRRAFRRGGAIHGEKSAEHAGRKPRKAGGRTLVDDYMNRDAKEANPGAHVGGYARGGHADAAKDKQLIHAMGCKCAKCAGGRVERAAGGAINDGTRPTGGRLARKGGGRAKKGMNVNIIIAQPKSPTAMPMGMPPPGAGPVGLHQGMPPPMPPAGAAAPMGPAPMPMARKAGGKVDGHFAKPGRYPLKDGAGGGKGRLEKARAYG